MSWVARDETEVRTVSATEIRRRFGQHVHRCEFGPYGDEIPPRPVYHWVHPLAYLRKPWIQPPPLPPFDPVTRKRLDPSWSPFSR